MSAQKHAELEICDFNAKTREFILYDRRKNQGADKPAYFRPNKTQTSLCRYVSLYTI